MDNTNDKNSTKKTNILEILLGSHTNFFLEHLESFLGGLFGILAIAAAVAEMFVSGINPASILGMLKDAFGTLAAVIMLFALIKILLPKKIKAKSFEEKLEAALNNWISSNSNMLVKTPQDLDLHKNHNSFGIHMAINPLNFYSSSN